MERLIDLPGCDNFRDLGDPVIARRARDPLFAKAILQALRSNQRPADRNIKLPSPRCLITRILGLCIA